MAGGFSMLGRMKLVACLLGLGAALPSAGQQPRPETAGLPELVVVDSTDLSAYRGHLLSWRVADALAVAVEAEGRWAVVPRRQVRREIEARNLAPPLVIAYAQLLADVLHAGFALRGTIQSCEVSSDGAQVKLILLTDLIEGQSGDIIASETTEGTANAPPGEPAIVDALVEEAVHEAAEAAARTLPAFRRLNGMVYALMGKRQALINLGREHGLKKGEELVVYREGYDEETRAQTATPVGRVKVVELGPTDATCTILKGSQPLQRHDVIHALLPVAAPEQEQGLGSGLRK